jgi:gliding motility-associated lipoprotein GldH
MILNHNSNALLIKATVLSICLSILFIMPSCKNSIYSERITIEKYQWFSSSPAKFSAEIGNENIKRPLSLILNLRYIQGFPYKFLKVRVMITDLKGNKNYKDLDIQVINDDLKYIGNGAGDYWDLDYHIDDRMIFDSSGTYTFEVFSRMENDPVLFLNTIGLTIKE